MRLVLEEYNYRGGAVHELRDEESTLQMILYRGSKVSLDEHLRQRCTITVCPSVYYMYMPPLWHVYIM